MSLAGTSQAEYNDIWHRKTLAGDLFGRRSWLDERGIDIEMVYTGETFSNLRGGLNTSGASEHRDLFDMTLTADAEKFGLGPGSIFIYAQLGNGTGITEERDWFYELTGKFMFSNPRQLLRLRNCYRLVKALFPPIKDNPPKAKSSALYFGLP